MQLLLYLASFGKVRKDELMGFLELATDHKETVELNLQNLIRDGYVEVGTYQKLSLAKNEDFIFQKAMRQMVTFGIPPYQLVAFLHNQGISDTMDIIEHIEDGIDNGIYRSNGAGIIYVNEPKQLIGSYVDSPWYVHMRMDMSHAQGVS